MSPFAILFLVALSLNNSGNAGAINCCATYSSVVKQYGDEFRCSIGQLDEDFKCDSNLKIVTWPEIDEATMALRLNESWIPPTRYCLGKISVEQKEEAIALICTENEDTFTEYDSEGSWRPELSVIALIAVLCSLMSAVIYCLPETQDILSKCIFHVALNWALVHITEYLAVTTIMPCNFQGYLAFYSANVLTLWSFILSMITWKIARKCKLEVNRGVKKYCFIAYGGPILMVSLTILISSPFTLYGADEICTFYPFARILGSVHFVTAIFLSAISCFYFVDCVRRLHSLSKFCVTTRLAILTDCFKLPALLTIFLKQTLSKNPEVPVLALLGMNSYGIMLFLAIVITRKKVLHGLARLPCCCHCFASKWATMSAEELKEEPFDAPRDSVSVQRPEIRTINIP